MGVAVKICGITTASSLRAAADGGAAFIGFVFYPPSPRNVTLDAAAALRAQLGPGTKAVALVVDAGDATIAGINSRVSPDVFQLHGRESVKRVAAIGAMTGKPIIKALPVGRADDLAEAPAYEAVADWLMFDARQPEGAASPGGGGISFDWRLLGGRNFGRPWFLAAGLNARNLKAAVDASGARLVDVSSGVERARGEKDEGLIRAFLDTARAL
jgi:phosphoribosylanthranilate isomerase